MIGGGSVRQTRRKHSGEYAHLRGKAILTPDGLGLVLGDSNKFRGSRKVVVRLEDKRVRHYSYYELSPLNRSTPFLLDTWVNWG